MIEIFLSGIISGIVAGLIVILYSKYVQFKRVSKVITYAQNILDELENRVINTRLEFDNNCIRAYNSDSDEFLAQGISWEEINLNLKKRYPNNFFNVAQEQIIRAEKFSK
jgi:hypothetical protein